MAMQMQTSSIAQQRTTFAPLRWMLTLLLAIAIPVLAQTADAPAKRENPDDFITLYPGVFSEREKALATAYLAANRALTERGPIDVKALVSGTLPKDTPGIGPVVYATDAWVRYFNQKYDPENPLRNDSAYARMAGFQDILAYPTIAAHDDTFMVPYPSGARDKLLVSDLNHSVTAYRPIYPGDTLYMVMNERTVTDLTPVTGSKYRSLAIRSTGSIYNQRGEKVNDVIFRVTESIRVNQPGKELKNPSFMDIWEAPDWLQRPAHFYTDKDWKKLRDIWSRETVRGATPLYWEDVKIGDEPTWTAEGPVLLGPTPTKPWGQGTGGSRTTKKEILDPALFKTMIRGAKDGIWRLPNRADYVPSVPAAPGQTATAVTGAAGAINTADIHKEGEQRSPFVNFLGRDYAIRHLTNWMGDRGWLYNIRWSIMDPRAHERWGKSVVTNPDAEHYLHRVPKLKGKYVNTHGLSQDVAIVKSYVYDKYVRDGEHFVELVWWIETITGDIYEEGGATVRLPSKTG